MGEAISEVTGHSVRPTVQELVDRASALAPVLRDRAPLTEDLRRIPDETVAEFKEAGFVRMVTPERYGGFGYGVDAVAEVVQQIGRGCGSSAWMCSFWPTHQYMVGWFSRQAQDEYFASGPDTLSSTASAMISWSSEEVTGGIRVTGSHKFSSGCDHADWLLVTSQTETCLVPRSDVEIEDDWFVAGLKGTGSKTVRYADIFIPEHRIVPHKQFENDSYPGHQLYRDNPFYQIPNPPGMVLPHAILAAVIATAGGVVEMFDERVRRRMDTLTLQPALERQITQHHFAESAAEHDIALMLMRRNLQQIIEQPDMPLLERARIRRDATYATHLSVRLVDRLTSSGDASALYEANHMARLARDVRAGGLQFALGWDETAIQYSRVRWGLPPQTFLV